MAYFMYFGIFLSFFSVFAKELIIKGEHNRVLIPCENNDDCDELQNATCKNGICECNQSSVCIDEVNRVVTKIGEPCKYLNDCNIANSYCGSNHTCVCEDGMVKSSDERRCLKISDGIGDHCEESTQCLANTPFSSCRGNKCVCQQDRHENNGTCYRNVALGMPCGDDGECSSTQFAECVESKCTCLKEFVAYGTRCLLKARGINSPCVTHIQCTDTLGGASKCSDGFCLCKENYQHKQSLNKCVRDMRLGESCMNNSECYGTSPGLSRLECVLDKCICRSAYIEETGFCISGSTVLELSMVFLILGLCTSYLF